MRCRAVVLAGASATALAACLRSLPPVAEVVVVAGAPGRFVAAEGVRLAGAAAVVLVLPHERGPGAAALAAALLLSDAPADIALTVAGEPFGPLPAAVFDEASRAARSGAWVDVVGGPATALVALDVLGAHPKAALVRAAVAQAVIDPDFVRVAEQAWAPVPELALADVRPPVHLAMRGPAWDFVEDPASPLDGAVVERPWGTFQALTAGPRYKVKRIIVEVGGSLSLQRHQHRSEHWVVVRGRARVVRGRRVLELGERASTFIPCGVVHRLENVGDVPLEVIEVQTGDRVDESDIERLDDRYGRAGARS